MDAARLTGPAAVAAGISGGHADVPGDQVHADLVVLTEPTATFVATVADGGAVPRPCWPGPAEPHPTGSGPARVHRA